MEAREGDEFERGASPERFEANRLETRQIDDNAWDGSEVAVHPKAPADGREDATEPEKMRDGDRRSEDIKGEAGHELRPSTESQRVADDNAWGSGRSAAAPDVVRALGTRALEGTSLDSSSESRTGPGDAIDARADDGVPTEWRNNEIRDLTSDAVEHLRETAPDGRAFSESRMAWVPVDAIDATDEVQGEDFKGGERKDDYVQSLTDLHAERDSHRDLESVDPRFVGDYRIRLCEDPESGAFTITDGRHRIQAAREAGIDAVPADVVVAAKPPAELPPWADGRAGDITFGTSSTDTSHRTFWTRDGQVGDSHNTTELVDGKLNMRTHEGGWIEGWTEDLDSGEVERFRRRER